MKAFLFDIGATLIDGPKVSPIQQLCQIMKLDRSERERIAHLIMCQNFAEVSELLEALHRIYSLSVEQVNLIEQLWQDQENCTRKIAGSVSLIRILKERGFKIGLVSNIWAPYYRSFQATCPEIVQMVDFAALSFREGWKKPSPRLLQIALEHLGSEQVWMVGDSYENDLRPAQTLSVQTIWLLRRPEKEVTAMQKILLGEWSRPDVIVDSLKSLQKKIEFWR